MAANLPPWLRKLKQSWYFQLIIQPFLGVALPVLYTSSSGFSNITRSTITASGIAGLGALYSSYQSGFNDPSYNSSGTPNQQVAEVVKADSANATVAVVPVSSLEAREQIRAVVDAGGPVAVVAAPEPALSAQIKAADADPRTMTTASIASIVKP